MINFFRHYKGLPKGIYVLCFGTLINRLGDFVVPFLSLYLTQKIGMSAWASGMIVTVSSIICIPSALIGGRVADMYGRKKIYLFAQSLSAIALIPCAVTQNAGMTVVCLLISTFFNGFVRPAYSSMATDLLSAEQRQAGFSLQYLSINLGVSIGPVIAGFLFNNFLPMLFIGDAMTSIIAVLLIWRNIKETHAVSNSRLIENKIEKDANKAENKDENKAVHSYENEAEKAEKGNIFQLFYKRPYLFWFFLLNIVYCFIYTQHKFTLPITMNEVFANNGAKLYGYLMSINAITVLILTAFISNITRKNHQLTNMVLSGLFYAAGFGMIGYANNYALFVLSTVIWTGGEILSTISSGVYVANNSPNNYRARLNAVSSIGHAVGASLSTAVSGIYIEYNGVKSIWILVFVISLVAAVLMYSLRKRTSKTVIKEYAKA